jgi:hypothetical protein
MIIDGKSSAWEQCYEIANKPCERQTQRRGATDLVSYRRLSRALSITRPAFSFFSATSNDYHMTWA